MPQDFDITPHLDLLARCRSAFLVDSSYAIAIAKPAGAQAARRREREALMDELDD